MKTSRLLALAAVLPGTSIASDLLDYPGPGYRAQPEQILLHQEKAAATKSVVPSPGLFKLPPSERRTDLLQPGKVTLSLEPNAPAAPAPSPQKKVE